MRDRRGWQRKGWLIAAVFVAMMIGWYLDQRLGKGLRIGLTGAIILCMGIAVFVGFLSDLGLSEVQATAGAVARAFYGHGVGASLWRYEDILTFSFIPRESSGNPFGLLILVMCVSTIVLGVPDRVSRSELVEFFRSRGVQEAQTPNQITGANSRYAIQFEHH
jgi:hydrogenase/urease accessory protein HupE